MLQYTCLGPGAVAEQVLGSVAAVRHANQLPSDSTLAPECRRSPLPPIQVFVRDSGTSSANWAADSHHLAALESALLVGAACLVGGLKRGTKTRQCTTPDGGDDDGVNPSGRPDHLVQPTTPRAIPSGSGLGTPTSQPQLEPNELAPGEADKN